MATTQSVKTQSEFVTVLRSLAADPLGLTGLIIVSLIFFTAIFAEWVMPYDPIALNIKDRYRTTLFEKFSSSRFFIKCSHCQLIFIPFE